MIDQLCPVCDKKIKAYCIEEFLDHVRSHGREDKLRGLPILYEKNSKYKNKRTMYNNMWFQSKREADYCAKLDLLRKEGHIKYYLRQVPFHLPGRLKYLVDFMVVWCETWDRIEYIDVKGHMTPVSRNKIKQVAELYGVKICLK